MAIRLEKEGPVSTIVLERSDVRNAVDATMANALAQAFREVEADPATRAAVLDSIEPDASLGSLTKTGLQSAACASRRSRARSSL